MIAGRASAATGTPASDQQPAPDVPLPIGEVIRATRKLSGKTIKATADAVGITQRYLELIEAGTRIPTLGMCERIALALDVDPSMLRPDLRRDCGATDDIRIMLDELAKTLPPRAASRRLRERPDLELVQGRISTVLGHVAAARDHYREALAVLGDLLPISGALVTLALLNDEPAAASQAVTILRLVEEVVRPEDPWLADAAALLARRVEDAPAT